MLMIAKDEFYGLEHNFLPNTPQIASLKAVSANSDHHNRLVAVARPFVIASSVVERQRANESFDLMLHSLVEYEQVNSIQPSFPHILPRP